MDVLGDDYISQHIQNEYKKKTQDKIFKMYIADCLYLAGKNKTPASRLSEILYPIEKTKDEYSNEEYSQEKAREIKSRILNKLKGRAK